jgi:hypothetical protein
MFPRAFFPRSYFPGFYFPRVTFILYPGDTLLLSQGLFAYLTTHASLGPAVSNGSTFRVFPMLIPQHVRADPAKLPCVVYQMTQRGYDNLFCGTDSVVLVRVQLDIYDRTYDGALELAALVRGAMIDYGGLMGTITVKRVQIEDEFDAVDDDPGLYRVQQMYRVWHLDPSLD